MLALYTLPSCGADWVGAGCIRAGWISVECIGMVQPDWNGVFWIGMVWIGVYGY
jgi:hypothetical protein